MNFKKIGIVRNFHHVFAQYRNKTSACSCIDCAKIRPPMPAPPKPMEPFENLGIDGYAFWMSIVFCILTSFFLLLLYFFPTEKTRCKFA